MESYPDQDLDQDVDMVPDEEMEAQMLTDPDTQEDQVYELGADGKMHEVTPEGGDDDAPDD